MSLDTFVVLANQYKTETDALADHDAVRKLYKDSGIIDTYDAAVLTRKSNGNVEIVKRTEEPTCQGAASIVDAVLYLARAGQVTSEVIHVDGGSHAGR